MATRAEVRRIALSLPAADKIPGRFACAVRSKGKLKSFAWVWMERVTPKKPRVPEPRVVAVRTASLEARERMLALDATKFFTEPHYVGFPAILVRLPAVTVRELERIVTEGWRCEARRDLTVKQRPPRRRTVVPKRRSPA